MSCEPLLSVDHHHWRDNSEQPEEGDTSGVAEHHQEGDAEIVELAKLQKGSLLTKHQRGSFTLTCSTGFSSEDDTLNSDSLPSEIVCSLSPMLAGKTTTTGCVVVFDDDDDNNDRDEEGHATKMRLKVSEEVRSLGGGGNGNSGTNSPSTAALQSSSPGQINNTSGRTTKEGGVHDQLKNLKKKSKTDEHIPTSINLHHQHEEYPSLISSDQGAKSINVALFQGAGIGVLIFALLSLLVYAVPSRESFVDLDGGGKRACWTYLAVLFATNGSRLGPLIFQHDGSFHFLKSGLLVGSFTIQIISMIANLVQVTVPTPIVIDPITGMRIHLLRMASWVPLAFIMTFLTEAIDLQSHSKSNPAPGNTTTTSYKVAWWHATAMAASTAAGLVFPFCTNMYAWWGVMIVSWLLFLTIFVRLHQRYSRYRRLRQELQDKEDCLRRGSHCSKGTNHDDDGTTNCMSCELLSESVEKAKTSFKLILLCSISWTAIAASFTVCCFLPHYAPTKDSALTNEELHLIVGYALEAVSKVWYLSLKIHVYEKVFDENSKAVQRLNELRTLMSALWVTSSDLLVVCAESETTIHAVVSPNALLKDHDEGTCELCNATTVLEVSKINGSFFSFPMDLSEPFTHKDSSRIQRARETASYSLSLTGKGSTTKQKNLFILASLARQVYSRDANGQMRTNYATWPIQEMQQYHPETNRETVVHCETKATLMETGGVLLVLRDVSERYQRFQIEKQLLEEVIVRKKDAEAIRFTRHEVKNGLLSAIGIVDTIKEERKNGSDSHASDHHINDLDVALNDILSAILDNAMIREVVYEGYVPRRESVNLPALLDPKQRARSSCGGAITSDNGTRQFPLFASPQPFPNLLLDPQLIHKIYNNSVSNACKYGKKDGDVKTFLSYDYERKMLRMEVVNLPGYGHEALLGMTKEKANTVFLEGTQLKVNQCLDTAEGKLASARSAGDGAWIMQKCAQCLGGSCDICVTPDGTTLSFECPAEVCEDWQRQKLNASSHEATFELPSSTWAVVLEDSLIQQKLLGRFLNKAGIAKERCVIMGKSAEEIFGFEEKTKELMRENPEDKFLLVVDENLDINEGGSVTRTVSGSSAVQRLIQALTDNDKARMLALIRSANDSLEEVELYKSRAHGFLLKGPMKKGLLHEIKPWWKRRFLQRESSSQNLECLVPEKVIKAHAQAQAQSALDEFAPTRGRILELVRGIDALCGYHPLDVSDGCHCASASSGCFKSQDWQPIRYRLLLLNVDLKINSYHRDCLTLAAKAIDELTSKDNDSDDGVAPGHLLNKWIEIRDLITRGVED